MRNPQDMARELFQIRDPAKIKYNRKDMVAIKQKERSVQQINEMDGFEKPVKDNRNAMRWRVEGRRAVFLEQKRLCVRAERGHEAAKKDAHDDGEKRSAKKFRAAEQPARTRLYRRFSIDCSLLLLHFIVCSVGLFV